MAKVFYVDVLFTAPESTDKLVYPKCNMAVVTLGDHEKVASAAAEGVIARAALSNLTSALMRKQPPMVDQPDIEFALSEARKVLGFPFSSAPITGEKL